MALKTLEIPQSKFFDTICLAIAQSEVWGENNEKLPPELIESERKTAKAIVIALVELVSPQFGGEPTQYKGILLPKILIQWITENPQFWPDWYDKKKIHYYHRFDFPIKEIDDSQPHESYGNWELFLSQHCQLRKECQGVRHFASVNCNYILFPNGELVRNYGFWGDTLLKEVQDTGWEATLQSCKNVLNESKAIITERQNS